MRSARSDSDAIIATQRWPSLLSPFAVTMATTKSAELAVARSFVDVGLSSTMRARFKMASRKEAGALVAAACVRVLSNGSSGSDADVAATAKAEICALVVAT